MCSFDQEAAQQVRSGEPGDHLNLWEAPGYFNNRGIEDLARDKMDARSAKVCWTRYQYSSECTILWYQVAREANCSSFILILAESFNVRVFYLA